MRKIVAFGLLLTLLLFLCSCGLENAIVGTWTSEETVLGITAKTSYTFEKDGTGSVSTVLDVNVPFTYTVEKNTLTITKSVLGVVADKDVYKISIRGGVLSMDSDTLSLRLTKEK